LTTVDTDQIRAGNYSELGTKLSIVHEYDGTLQFNAFSVANGAFSTLSSFLDPLIGVENSAYGDWTFFNTCHNFVQDAAALVGVPLDDLDGFRATPSGSAESLLSSSGGVLYNVNTGFSLIVDYDNLGFIEVSIAEEINSGNLSQEGAINLLRLLIMSGDTYMTKYVALGILQTDASCFGSGTTILVSDGTIRPIETIRRGDLVLSYDATGTLVPGRVTRTFRHEVSHLLDVHGLKVTPGHATLCGDGMFKGRHVPIIDILLSDGALVQADGTLVRMAINTPVGATEDRFVKVAYALTAEDAQSGRLQEGEMRAGTLLFDRDGVPVSVLQCLTAGGYVFDPETGLVARPGEAPHPLYWFGKLPRPEDYILARSQETLAGILTDGEWEGPVSQLIEGRLRETNGRFN
jgi:hypothetical protein